MTDNLLETLPHLMRRLFYQPGLRLSHLWEERLYKFEHLCHNTMHDDFLGVNPSISVEDAGPIRNHHDIANLRPFSSGFADSETFILSIL
jgi:hypothetical protein